MALLTFDPPVLPSPGTSNTPRLKLLKTEFGDGYSQITRDGLNHQRDVVELRWAFLTHIDANQITAFFEERGGDRAFWFRPSHYAAAKKWTCETWSDQINDQGFRTISATLEQSFTLET